MREEDGGEALAIAMLASDNFIIAPVLVELHRVTSLDGNIPDPDVVHLLDRFQSRRTRLVGFDPAAANLAVEANTAYGSGNGRVGKLNMLDLMVYGTAKALDLSILCTGYDFSSTDAKIHPASRIG
jgi:ribonuclease VapC